MTPRPYALLAELTHACPLHCPYCSNPTHSSGAHTAELTTDEWRDVLQQAAAMGVLQVGFSGGEPLLRRDLEAIVASARAAGLYSNLITSGIGLTPARAIALREAGLDSIQLSFQADEPELADRIAGTRAHLLKIAAAAIIHDAGFPLTTNVVLHRHNLGRLNEIIAFIASLGARRVELANAQYYGWAWENRLHLLPTREQLATATETVRQARERYGSTLEILYVPADYFGTRPKPCLHGWGQSHLTVAPTGEVLPCPTAWSIKDLTFDSIRTHRLADIWASSDSFQRFRGTDWLPDPCHSCPERERDFGGCRCQAALYLSDAAQPDPVCTQSPHRSSIDAIIAESAATPAMLTACTPRQNPQAANPHHRSHC